MQALRHLLRSARVFTHVDASVKRIADRPDEFFRVSLFPEVAVSSRLQRSARVKRCVVHGDNQQLNLAIHRAELFNQFQPALARQSDIHQHQVRPDTANGFEGAVSGAGFTAYSQVFLTVDNPQQRFAKNRVVLDIENPLSRRAVGPSGGCVTAK